MRGRPPPQDGAVAEAGGDHSVHVEEWGDLEGTRVDDPSPDSKG